MVAIIPADTTMLKELQRVSRTTFLQTFGAVNTAENMRHYLEHNLSEQQLSVELSNPNSAFYFALIESEIAGYLKINFAGAQTDIQDPRKLEVERIYVLQLYQGKQVGKALLEKALAIAKEKGMVSVWLGVWEHNTKAISFYTQFGFLPFAKHSFFLGEDEQIDVLMEKSV